MRYRVAFGSDDHNECVTAVLDHLRSVADVEVVSSGESWPEFSRVVGEKVVRGEADFGVLMCWTGTGTAIAANKVRGVRAALCNDLFTARLSREHNDANVLSMGGRIVADGLADEILRLWLATPFEGGRHETRLAQIADIEGEG